MAVVPLLLPLYESHGSVNCYKRFDKTCPSLLQTKLLESFAKSYVGTPARQVGGPFTKYFPAAKTTTHSSVPIQQSKKICDGVMIVKKLRRLNSTNLEKLLLKSCSFTIK